MLQVNFIRENFDQAVEGLQKRFFAEPAEKLQKVLDLDKERKETQLPDPF